MKLRRAAYTVQALVDAGVPVEVARTLMSDGPNAPPERALVAVGGRKRTKEPITGYVWGPDVAVLLADHLGTLRRDVRESLIAEGGS